MRSRLSIAGFLIVAGLSVLIPTTGEAAGAAPTGSTNQPPGVDLCQRGGWQNLTNAQGQTFGNQGQCISYFIHNPVSLADLTGTFSGTTTWTFGCDLVSQVFDANYPGTSAVGSVIIHLEGCINVVSLTPEQVFSYSGMFTIATNVGTLSGTVAGTETSGGVPAPVDIQLTLTVLSGTGAFAATTGAIHVSIVWSVYTVGVPSTYPVNGSVTVP